MEHGESFYGMSSGNEYWNKSTDTSSNDASSESLSSRKEYRDASCNVDSADEFDDSIVKEEDSAIENISVKSAGSRQSPIEKNVQSKSSRYIRWNILMSLGIGLWAVLCIVDLLHSEDSVTRGWLYESVRGKKTLSTIQSSIGSDSDVSWLYNSLPYLWRIISISTAGAAYILFFLLLIVFCADPRLRKIGSRTAVKNNLNGKISAAKIAKDSIVENKFVDLYEESARIVEPVLCVQRVPVRLESTPAICLRATFLSSIEERVAYELTSRKPTETHGSFGAPREVSSAPKILHGSSRAEYRNYFGIDKCLVARLNIASYETFKFANIIGPHQRSIVKESSVATLFPTDLGNETFAVRTFHLKIEEYTRTRKKYFADVFDDSFANGRDYETRREPAELPSNEELKTRIITSSPAFKTFLSKFKDNKTASLEVAATRHIFGNNLPSI